MTLNEKSLEKRFSEVSASQGGIQTLSFYCLHHKGHHKKITQIWLRTLQKSKVSHRLTLIYLANDIVQNAKRKSATSFIDDFKTILKDAVPYLRDEKIKKSVERVFSIWQDRSIFDGKYTTELKASLNNDGRTPRVVNAGTGGGENHKFSDPLTRRSTDDLMESFNRLAAIEKNMSNIRCSDDGPIDQLVGGAVLDKSDSKQWSKLRNYLSELKSEIEERKRLKKLLDDLRNRQKKLLEESESELNSYNARLQHVTKLRTLNIP